MLWIGVHGQLETNSGTGDSIDNEEKKRRSEGCERGGGSQEEVRRDQSTGSR